MPLLPAFLITAIALALAIGAAAGWWRAHKAAQRIQQRLNEQLAFSEEVALTGYWTDDGARRQSQWSPGMYRILGVDPATFTPRPDSLIEFFVPEQRDRVAAELDAVRGRGGHGRIEGCVRRPDGQLRDVALSVRCQREHAGAPSGLYGVISDVTYAKSAERIIAAREEQAEHAVSASRAAIWDWDLETGAIYISARFGEIVGLQTDPWAPNHELHERLLHPDDRGRLTEALANHLRHGAPFEVEYRLRHAKGHDIWVQSKGRAVASRAGKPVRVVGSLLDITQRREMDAALAQKQDMLELVVAAAEAGYFEYRFETGDVYWSTRMREILGVSADMPARMQYVQDRIYAEDLPEYLLALDNYNRTGTPLDVELRVQHADGHYVWLHVRAVLQCDPGGRRISSIGFVLDVSARREAQQALQDSERKFRNLIEGSIQGVVIHRRYRPLFCNPAYARLLGYETVEEVLALESLETHHFQERADEAYEFWDRASRGLLDGKVFRRKIHDREGRELWFEAAGRLIQWEGEAAWQMAVIDITDQKRYEDEIRASEERFRFLADNSSDVITLYEDTGRVLYTSPSVTRISGYSVEESVGRSPFEIVHPDDVEAVKARRLGRPAGPQGGSAVWRMRHKNGHWLWMESLATVIPLENGRYNILSTARDVTERVQREAELKAAHDRLQQQTEELAALARNLETERARAEQANLTKSQFLAMMSHELRTPMTGVIGMADLLLLSELNPDQDRLTRLLMSSARTLLDLLNDLLDFSKIESGQIEIERIPMSITEVVNDVSAIYATVLADKGIAFEVRIAPEVKGAVSGDPKRLRQIIGNLVSNAAKFTASGRIMVDVKMEPAAVGQNRLRISVADTGIGIAPADVAKLFRPFVQADLSTSRQYGGTGLGLAICKRLVLAMGGDITLESEPGKGSTFTFTALVGDADVAPALESAGLSVDTDGARALDILIAEDNETTRYLVSAMLGRLGHRVVAVPDGKQAVDGCAARSFDLILMDMQMPVMDGVEAMRRIRALQTAVGRVPIIALTADAIPEHHPGFIAAGANVVVVKPVVWRELGDHIDRLVPGAGVRRGIERGTKAVAVVAASDPTPASAAPAVLNEAVLDDLIAALGAEAIGAMLPTFVDNMREYQSRLDAAAAAQDLVSAKRAAHALKGLAAQFGAPLVSDLARRMEQDSKDIDDILSAMEALRRAVTVTASAIEERPKAAAE